MKLLRPIIIGGVALALAGGFALATTNDQPEIEPSPTPIATPVVLEPSPTPEPTITPVTATVITERLDNHEARITKLETVSVITSPIGAIASAVPTITPVVWSTSSGSSIVGRGPASNQQLSDLYASIAPKGEKLDEKYAACLAWPMDARTCKANQNYETF